MPNSFLELEEQLLECDSEIRLVEGKRNMQEHDISYLNSQRRLRERLILRLVDLGYVDWVVRYQLSMEV